MVDKKQNLFCPFIKENCKKELCALYLKNIELVFPGGKKPSSLDVKQVTKGCAIAVLATR